MSFREVAILAAKEAGEISRGYFREPIQVTFKARKDLVTVADVESEKKIVSIIVENFPDHGIMGEELPAHPSDSPYKWIIDPIDGTNLWESPSGLNFLEVWPENNSLGITPQP